MSDSVGEIHRYKVFSKNKSRGMNPLLFFLVETVELRILNCAKTYFLISFILGAIVSDSVGEIHRYKVFSKKKSRRMNPLLFFLVETVELESTTPCMSSKYSNQLSYASVYGLLYDNVFKFAIAFCKYFEIYKIFIEMN